MKMGEAVIEHSEKEKYLGDFIHENGCREIVDCSHNQSKDEWTNQEM